MKLNKQFLRSILCRIVIVGLLLAVLLAGMPVTRAQAYTGGYGLNFAAGDELMRVDYYGVFGPDPQCRNTTSISLWVRPMGASVSGPDFGSVPAIFTNVPNWIGIARGAVGVGGGADRIWVWITDQSFAYSYIGIPYTVGEWVHIALVHDGGRLRGYKNGVQVGDVAAGTMGGNTCGRIGIGAYYFGDQGTPPAPITLESPGQVDEVAIFQAALTENEIREYMYREIDASHPKWAQIGAYYKMSNGSGTAVTDNATGLYPGQIFGAVDWVTSAAHAGPRNSLAFNGVDEYINVADHPNLDRTMTVSFEAWVDPENWNNNAATPFVVKGDASGTPEVNYYFGKSATNQMMFSYYSSGGGRVDVVDTSGATYTDGVWTHLAYTVDAGNNLVRFYRDGLLLSEVSHDFTMAPLVANDRELTLARFLSSADAIYQGKLDEVRLWSSVRTADEIRQNMFQTLMGDAGLELYYRFDMYNATTQTIAYDMTNDKLNGTLQNMEANADWVTSDAFNTWIGTDDSLWGGAGNWSRNSAPTSTDNVGIYGYIGGNNPSFSTPQNVGNLVVASTGSLTASSGGSLTVSGRLFNYGLMQQTQAVNGDGDIGFFNTGNYGGLLIDPNADNMGDTTVVIRGNQDCTTMAGDTVKRCFDITPGANNAGIGKTVTFFFDQGEESGNACDSLNAYHNVAGAWVPLSLDLTYNTDGRLCGSDPRSVRVVNLTSFSPFVLNQNAPTAIELVSFSGTTRSGNVILVSALTTALVLLGIVLCLGRRRHAG